ncbi:MAG: hypothetical protein ACOCZ8_00230 [Bacteroidota bacterium]
MTLLRQEPVAAVADCCLTLLLPFSEALVNTPVLQAILSMPASDDDPAAVPGEQPAQQQTLPPTASFEFDDKLGFWVVR